MRGITHDTTLGGVDIPGGSTVVLMFGSANRDLAQFDAPDVVDLDRASPRGYLAFSHGINYCVGAALARIEAKAVLSTPPDRTSKFVVDPDGAPRWAESFVVRRHEHLPLRVHPLKGLKTPREITNTTGRQYFWSVWCGGRWCLYAIRQR
jgi:cytochrome P450